jgi:hypothetical protein
MLKSSQIFILTVSLILVACGSSEKEEFKEDMQDKYEMSFSILGSEETGIDFVNTITETDSFNFFNYEYIYNGGGVAVGDINNDGLEDIYFTGNQVSDRLYLNEGNLKFKDITSTAIGPLSQEGWHTGVLMQDINQDGFLDIYVSRSGPDKNGPLLSNLLFINNGDQTFSEESSNYGLNDRSTTTQSVFFDMDNDGDLDLFLLNHPQNTKNSNEPTKSLYEVEEMTRRGSPYSDRLYENKNGIYTEITKKAGLNNHAFGLGVAVTDFNNDGYADLYISNDYMAPDYVYINQGDGTFKDKSMEMLKHMSNYSMGNDVADFNNDGLVDIMTVDMAAEDHVRSKRNMGGMSTKRFWEVVRVGYHYQYMFNCLQLNNGNGTFSDIAQMSGVSKTDWSWAPLLADFDNDGQKDLFITNGYRRDTRDNDYLRGHNPTGQKVETFEDALNLMPSTKVSNYMYKNNGDLTFTNVGSNWGLDDPINSNGAAFSDLDNDGDLDLIINNMEDQAQIFQNNLRGHNHLKIKFSGSSFDGAKIKLTANDQTQYQEYRTVRGYQSSVSHLIHFGLGTNKNIDEVYIEYPNGKSETIKNVAVNQILEVNSDNAKENARSKDVKGEYFEFVKELDYMHQEKQVNDFEREVLLPNKMSQLGPFMSKGDVNADGVEDFYVSGARGFSGKLFLGEEAGYKATASGPWDKNWVCEELGSVFFDADNDGDLDLYVVSGSNEYDYDDKRMKDHLYINDGNGRFVDGTDLLPEMMTSGQAVVAGDYDADGDQDLFIGGRQTPGFYPFAPRSYLLENTEEGFTEVTSKSPDLMGPGMITDAQFYDLDQDKDLDLVCVGEWMSPKIYRNDGGTFVDNTMNYNVSEEVGWWSSVAIDDLNKDGKPDFVFGNVGLNNKFHPNKEHPLEIYTHDFDKNGTYDIVLGKYQDGTCYPVRGKQCSSEQMPFISNKFPTYGEFAIADLEKIYGQDQLDQALHFTATEFGSMVLLSSAGSYEKVLLPNEAQLGPLNAILIEDFTGDGNLDVLAVGNNYSAEVETVRYDGGRGVLLQGDGNGDFIALSPLESGFFVNLDAKDMIITDQGILVSNNLGPILLFRNI